MITIVRGVSWWHQDILQESGRHCLINQETILLKRKQECKRKWSMFVIMSLTSDKKMIIWIKFHIKYMVFCSWLDEFLKLRNWNNRLHRLSNYDMWAPESKLVYCTSDYAPSALDPSWTCNMIPRTWCNGYCSGSLEPEYSCHDRDWIMELPMEADILTFTGILTPEDASVASCSPLISRSA